MSSSSSSDETELPELVDQKEIGDEAVVSLSTAKPGYGVQQLRDDNLETYWQSDGLQPHLINIQFHKKMKVQDLFMHVDYKLDESYTPGKISVRTGTTTHDLKEIQQITFSDPRGWVSVPLTTEDSKVPFIKTNFIQIAVLSNLQNGKDTHVRQLKVFAPPASSSSGKDELENFSTIEFSQFSCLH